MVSEELVTQIAKTLDAILQKYASEPEKVLVSYISRYERALEIIQGTTREITDVKVVKPLLNLARGYMETSSNYSQPFLEEMGKTESLIKHTVRALK